MTQNQLAYQQNLIKAREAAVKEQEQKLKTSTHLHDYGHIRVPIEGSDVTTGGTLLGMKQWVSGSEFYKNLAQSLSPLISALGK